jgi:ribosome-associated protein
MSIDGSLIRVTPRIALRPDDLEFHFVRASGPGGQNVNKVSTAVELRFDAARCPRLPDFVRERLLRIAGHRATSGGIIVISADRFRSQRLNREDAVQRLVDLIAQAATVPRARVATRPTVASERRRIAHKRSRSELKRQRGRVREES